MDSKPILMLFAVLLLLVPSAFAELTDNDLANFNSVLNTKIEFNNTRLNTSPQVILVRIVASNPYDTVMPIFVLHQDDDGWKTMKILGGLAPRTDTAMELEVEVRYDKETVKKTLYAVVAKGDNDQTYGAYFEVVEDWGEYERSINNDLTAAIVVVVPILAAILVFLVIMVAQAEYAGKAKYDVSQSFDGYNMALMQDQKKNVEAVDQKIAEVLMKPVTFGFEMICVGILVLIMANSIIDRLGVDAGLKIMVLSAFGSFTVPFIYFLAAWYLLKREEGKHAKFFVSMFIWGMFVAFVSFVVSSVLVGELRDLGVAPYVLIATIMITPFVEECLKGIGVFFMSGHKDYNDTLTGLLLGFTCGVGFAFVENWFYFTAKANPFDLGVGSWTMFILYRSFFNSLAHGCFTGAISATMGYVRGMPKLAHFTRLAFIPGLVLAIAIHTVFNLSAVADSFLIPNREAIFFVFNPMLIILLAAMFFLMLVLAVVDEKNRRMNADAAAAAAAAAAVSGGKMAAKQDSVK